MPQLSVDAPSVTVNGVYNLFPSFCLFRIPDTWCVRPFSPNQSGLTMYSDTQK